MTDIRNILKQKKKNYIKNSNIKVDNINSNHKTIKLFKPNCYYNNLHLQKMSKNLEKYTYLNEDDH